MDQPEVTHKDLDHVLSATEHSAVPMISGQLFEGFDKAIGLRRVSAVQSRRATHRR
jgi:hypothetical protein